MYLIFRRLLVLLSEDTTQSSSSVGEFSNAANNYSKIKGVLGKKHTQKLHQSKHLSLKISISRKTIVKN